MNALFQLLPGLLSITTFLAAKQPNIVFFFTDDQTISTLGCYGNPIVQTPNIDAIASRGTRFQKAFVSHPICWASRASILTGMTARTNRTPGHGDKVRPEALVELYSDLLRKQNFRTGYFGKWHIMAPKDFKREDHFDEFEAIRLTPHYKIQPDGSLKHETDLIVDRGIEFLKNQPKDKPFALNLWFNACHADDSDRRPGTGHFPWPPSSDGLYKDAYIGPPRLADPAIFDALPDFLKTSITRERFFWRWNTPKKYETNLRAYYRMVTGIDTAIGRFLKALDASGLADNTIVIYSADNGYHMGNRGLSGKWSHYEESIQVPLIIADPRVPKAQQGKVTTAPVLNLDLPATFLDWAGISQPARYDGHSLRPLLEGEKPADWRTQTFHEHFAVRNRIPAYEGIRTETHKYIRYIDHDYEFLHDLKNDPDELANLAKDPEYAGILKEMRQRTNDRVQELGGPLDPPKKPFITSSLPHPSASASPRAEKNAANFRAIFNGKTLDRWSGNPKYWSIEDGAITGITDGTLKKNRFITWKDSTVQNFELRLKVRFSKGANSGIQYRGTLRPEIGQDVVSGPQCDIKPSPPKHNGMLYEERGRQILASAGQRATIDDQGKTSVTEQMPIKEFAHDVWHDYRILVRGNHHQHWINDHQTVDLVDLNEKDRALEGVLGFQVHTGPAMKVQFREIRLKNLPDHLPLLNQLPVQD